MSFTHPYDVAVVTAFHTEPDWMLMRNIMSVRLQKTKYSYRHILVNDNPERNADWVRGQGMNIVYMKNIVNMGFSGTRNVAMFDSGVSSEYVMILDADDSFTSGRIEKQIDFMREFDLAHSFGGYQELHGNNPLPRPEVTLPPDDNPLSYLLKMTNVCYSSSNCVRRDVITKIGGFDELLTRLGAEDLEMWLRISLGGYKQKSIQEALYLMGVHGSNNTAKLLRSGSFERAYEIIKKKHNIL